MKTIIILSHGSRHENGNSLSKKIASGIEEKTGITTRIANLQLSPPYLDDVIEEEYKKGVREFLINPFFLHKGVHVIKDIPEYLKNLEKKYGDVKFVLTEVVGEHPDLVGIVENILRRYL